MCDERELNSDRSPLASPASARVFEGRVARTHSPADPLKYPKGNQYRRADQLPAIAAGLVGKPVTLDHPSKMLDAGGRESAHIVGEVISARVDDDTVVARILVTDAGGLALVDAGWRELSIGYYCRLDSERYQHDFELDHLAIVPVARCGAACAMRVDAADAILDAIPDDGARVRQAILAAEEAVATADAAPAEPCACKIHAMPHTGPSMTEAELQTKLAEATARADKAERELAQAQADAQNARRDLATETARADAAIADSAKQVEDLKAQHAAAAAQAQKDADDSLSARVLARVKLEGEANAVLGMDGAEARRLQSDRAVKAAVIKCVDGDDVDEKALDAYVDGVYDGAVKRHAKAGASRVAARATIVESRKDGAEALAQTPADIEAKAKADLNARTKTAYKTSN